MKKKTGAQEHTIIISTILAGVLVFVLGFFLGRVWVLMPQEKMAKVKKESSSPAIEQSQEEQEGIQKDEEFEDTLAQLKAQKLLEEKEKKAKEEKRLTKEQERKKQEAEKKALEAKRKEEERKRKLQEESEKQKLLAQKMEKEKVLTASMLAKEKERKKLEDEKKALEAKRKEEERKRRLQEESEKQKLLAQKMEKEKVSSASMLVKEKELALAKKKEEEKKKELARKEEERKKLEDEKKALEAKKIKKENLKVEEAKLTPTIPSTSSSEEYYTIQLNASPNKERVEELLVELRSRGYAAYAIAANIPDKGIWYRIRLGKYNSKEEAAKEAEILKSKGLISNYWITKK